jgi:hypothetical protein
MIRVFGHPRASSLSRYVDGELRSKATRWIDDHLTHCSGCREKVDFFRELGEAARQQSSTDVPDVADQVIRRRAQGERVVLDTSRWNRALAPGTLRAVAAIVVLVLGGAAAFLTLAPSASASRGELIFEPDEPTPGESIQIEYSPAFYLSDQDSLRLRVRARKADSPFPRGGVIGELRVATLHRNTDGNFTGRIQLEPSDVFLAAAVEDFEARNVDTNFGELWELLIRTDDGSPSVAALESRYRTLEPYNWIMASAWAEEVTRRWPDSPFGWALLYFHVSRTRTEALPDSIVGFHKAKLAALIEAQQPGREDPDNLVWLAHYARFLGDARLQNRLLDRLSDLDANHGEVIDRRVTEVLSESGQDPTALLNSLEEIWATSDRSNEFLVRLALETAVSAGNATAARVWLLRARQVEGVTAEQVVKITESLVTLAPERAEILQTELNALQAVKDEARPLRSTRQQYEADLESALLETRVALAGALMDAAATAAASVVLEDIWDVVWKPEDLRPVVSFLLTAGDTTAAIQGIAMLAADPIEGPTILEEYGAVLGAASVESVAVLEGASAELTDRVRSSLTTTRSLPSGIRVPILGANAVESQHYFTDRPTVLFMWSAELGDSEQLKDEFESLSGEPWAIDRIRAAILTTDPQVPESSLLVDRSVPVIHDVGYRLTEMLRAFAIPSYVVLGPDRRILATVPEASTAFRIAHHLAPAN